MFYPVQLLSHRRRGKLAPCWLAAMTNEKLFKKYYNPVAIKKMNITETCEEILQTLQICNGRSERFSLYLSSQLMYGITRILSYQITYYQKELFDFKIIFTTPLERPGEDFDAVRALDLLSVYELPITKQKFLSHQINEDLHVLPGEIPDGRLQVIMQDATCLNFGALTDEEMEFMLELNGDIALELKQKIHITDDSKRKSFVEMVTDAEIIEEIHRQVRSPRVISSPAIIDVSKGRDKSKERLPSTPQKRQPHQSQVETPTKRRRLSFEDNVIDVTLEKAPMPALESHAQDTVIPGFANSLALHVEEMDSLQHVERDMELESIHSSSGTFVIKKKAKIIDKITTLKDKILRQWRQTNNIYCRQLDMPQIHGPIPAIDLLKRPSQRSLRGSTSLRNLFVNNITGPFINADEDVPVKLIQSREAIRGLQRTADEYVGQTTSKLAELGEQAPTGEFSAVPIQDICITERTSHQEMEKDVNGVNDTLEDIEILLERQRDLSIAKNQVTQSSTRLMEKSQPAHLTSLEILTLLEVLLCDQEYIRFNEFISKETYTREDAANTFCILLEFHAQKNLVLQQAAFYHTLWIRKYENYSN